MAKPTARLGTNEREHGASHADEEPSQAMLTDPKKWVHGFI
jgi:hypothetical protein